MKRMLARELKPRPGAGAARATRWLGLSLLGLLLFSTVAAQGATATEAWVRRYNSGELGSEDRAFNVVVDPDGNAIVAGYTDDGTTGQDMLIIKYSGAGVALWTNRYNGPANSIDRANAVAVDISGNVLVTGSSIGSEDNFDYATIAYSATGVALWTNRYNGPGNIYSDQATAVAVDNSGNVVVTGCSMGSDTFEDYATIAYSSAGVALWTNRYNGPVNSLDQANAIAVDNSGNVFVTGQSYGGDGVSWDYATIAFSWLGVALWTNRYHVTGIRGDGASAVAVDKSGNVFVTGWSYGGTTDVDYATIAYSGAGVALWTNRYNGTGNSADRATAVAVDDSGNVFVTGYSRGSGGNEDYATIAYSGAGLALWTNRYNGPGNSNDLASALTVDGSGNAFVTGYSTGSGSIRDYATIAYSGSGVALWTNRYDGPVNDDDRATAVAVDNSGNVFATGYSVGGASGFDYATIKYSGAGAALWTNRYNGPAYSDDRASAVAVANSGNVFVTGYSIGSRGNYDYATIAYSASGLALWTNRYNGFGGSHDFAYSVATHGNGNVFVTGASIGNGGNHDYLTISYSGSGVALWTNSYNGPGNRDDIASALVVDNGGNVFVTGYSIGSGSFADYATIAYSGEGVALWTNRYNGSGNFDDYAKAVAVDNSGNVFVTGYSAGSGSGLDYATIAYSGDGVALWTNRYNGPAGREDQAYRVVVNNSSNVFVTGYSYGSGSASDYTTIAYSGAGAALWTNRYNGPGNSYDEAWAVAVDNSGNAFVTGRSIGNGGSYDYVTIAYSEAGVALWTNRYNGPGNSADSASNVAVDNGGNVFVTGYSIGSGSFADYATIAYSGEGVALWTNRYNGPRNAYDFPGGALSLAVGHDGALYVTGLSDGNNTSNASYDYATVKYVWLAQLAIQPLTAGSSTVSLTLSGAAASSWSIERALMVSGPWTNLGPSLIGTNGLGLFQDANPPAQGAFYRATQP